MRGHELTSGTDPLGSLLLPMQLHLPDFILELPEREDTHPFCKVSVWIQVESLDFPYFRDPAMLTPEPDPKFANQTS